MTRAEKERVKARVALLALSGVLGLVLLLAGGTLAWDKVYLAQRPVLRLDGQAVTLKAYADLLSYKKTVLEAEYLQASELASSPAPAGSDPSQNFLAQFAQQRMQQIQGQLSSLTFQLPDEIVDEKLIRAEAARRGITATPEEIETELKQIVGYQEPNPTPVPTPATTPAAGSADTQPTAAGTAAPTVVPTSTPRGNRRNDTFQQRYRDYQRYTGASDGLIRSQVELTVLRRKLNEEMGKSVPTTEEQVHARHILVTDEGVARSVLERLRAGETFDALAAEVSNDTSNKDRGGDLGWFGRGMMVKEFEDAVFGLPVGQLSEPVKTSFGYHIIRVDEKDPNRALEGSALENARAGALNKWLNEEEAKHTVEKLLTQDMIDWAERNGRQPAATRR
jgi:parvulin-like peptidyl-prolyl isomerase